MTRGEEKEEKSTGNVYDVEEDNVREYTQKKDAEWYNVY
jgi:hypothetical protein